jgi:hypothetical protein
MLEKTSLLVIFLNFETLMSLCDLSYSLMSRRDRRIVSHTPVVVLTRLRPDFAGQLHLCSSPLAGSVIS